MNKIFLSLFILMACNHTPEEIEISLPTVVSGNHPAGSPYFTNDNVGNPVLCWTEGAPGNEQIYYAVYSKEKESFQESIPIPFCGIGTHSETMNKVAFKKDGTIIAVFARKHPTEQNRFAGSLFYSESYDRGQTWTKEKFLHSDTATDNSRSYFDIALLPDGEVGAVWLDGRLKKGKDGSSLFFSKTKGKEGFQQDQQIGETVCQCCRTDIYTDQIGNVHVLYRDIEQNIKGQIRDFIHTVSLDSGNTFINSIKISDDNWVVEGCPHTGATIAGTQNQIEIVWFTAGGTPGLYYTKSIDNGSTFEPRKLISVNGSHPQLASCGKQSVIIWQELKHNREYSHIGHNMTNTQANKDNVVLVITENGNEIRKIIVDEEGEYPVLNADNEGLVLMAYTKGEQVIVKKIKIQNLLN